MTVSNGFPRLTEPSSLAHLSTALLSAELARRQDEPTERPACGSGDTGAVYNTSLHVIALIIILVLSTLACSFPIIAKRFPSLPIPHRFLFLSRHFGTGVLIATAFVHLLPTAFTNLTDPCLPPFWNQSYKAMPGLIAMWSCLVVVGIEMFFAARGAGHSHKSDFGVASAGRVQAGDDGRGKHSRVNLHPGSSTDEDRFDDALPLSRPTTGKLSPFDDEDNDDDHESDFDIDLDDLDESGDLLHPPADAPSQHPPPSDLESAAPTHTHTSPHHDERKELLQCLLLEAGILFHSIFIGMALSVATGASFAVLLVAISFHQTFEGLALGSRIASISAFRPGSPKPWLMALAYGTTTPLGQAVGLLVHNLYDPRSQAGLITVGVTNAISSGLLVFAGLVQLLAEDFLSDRSYEALRGSERVEACAAVVVGSMLMALVGAWA